MMKGKKIEICLLVIFLAICLHLSGMKTMACECPTVIGNVTYPEGWFLTYASDNPETIAPDSNETINIFGCRPPFTWSVSGNGFDLDWYETEGLFNTLIADDTACGAAEITITDNYGESVTGYVRCSNGQWVLYDTDSVGGCCAWIRPFCYNLPDGPPNQYTCINGDTKVLAYACKYDCSSPQPSCANAGPCGTICVSDPDWYVVNWDTGCGPHHMSYIEYYYWECGP